MEGDFGLNRDASCMNADKDGRKGEGEEARPWRHDNDDIVKLSSMVPKALSLGVRFLNQNLIQ
jgi:hypothetical protein